MAQNKLAKIETIGFMPPEASAYARALDGDDPAGNDTAAIAPMVIVGLASGGLAANFSYHLVRSLSPVIGIPIVVIALIGGFILGGWPAAALGQLAYRGARKRTLADPLCRFEWQLAKAIRIFDERARAFNHLLSGHELGFAQEDEAELARIHGFLSRTRETLARGKERRDWLIKNSCVGKLAPEPKLAPLLAELAEAECDLQEHLAGLKGIDGSSAKRLLDSEAELIELAGEEVRALLPEKT